MRCGLGKISCSFSQGNLCALRKTATTTTTTKSSKLTIGRFVSQEKKKKSEHTGTPYGGLPRYMILS